MTPQRTLPGWVPNTTVYDSLTHARAYPRTGYFTFQHVRNTKIERVKKNYLGNELGLFDLKKNEMLVEPKKGEVQLMINREREKYS